MGCPKCDGCDDGIKELISYRFVEGELGNLDMIADFTSWCRGCGKDFVTRIRFENAGEEIFSMEEYEKESE